MISKNSVIISESLVMNLGGSLHDRVGDIPRGLDELSYGAVPYGQDYRNEIVQETSGDTQHSDLMELASTKIAVGIRKAFQQIKDYAIPFTDAFCRSIEDEVFMGERSVQARATQNFNVNFFCVDNDFFISPLYPTEVKNKQLTYSSTDLSLLEHVKFEVNWSEEQFKSWLGINNRELLNVIANSEESLFCVFDELFNLDCLRNRFSTTDGKIFDFTKVKTFDLSFVFNAWIILSKMYASDEPMPLLKNGSLDHYRQVVSLMWNGLTQYLISLKRTRDVYANSGVTVIDRSAVKLAYKELPVVNGAVVSYQHLEGDCTVLYSTGFLTTLESQSITLMDWVVARYYGRLRDGEKVYETELTSKDRVSGLLANFYRVIRDACQRSLSSTINKKLEICFRTFIKANPTLLLPEDVKVKQPGLTPDAYYWDKFEEELDGSNIGGLIAGRVSDSGMGKVDLCDLLDSLPLKDKVLRTIGCPLAARIMAGTRTTYGMEGQNDTAEKRKKLHLSVIRAIVDSVM